MSAVSADEAFKAVTVLPIFLTWVAVGASNPNFSINLFNVPLSVISYSASKAIINSFKSDDAATTLETILDVEV